MTGSPRIVPLEAGTAGDDGVLELDQAFEESPGWIARGDEYSEAPPWEDEPARVSRWAEWAPTLLALAVVAAWSGFFAWANFAAMRAGAAPAQWADWLVAWSVPVLVVLAALLLLARTSRREAVRFTDIAHALRDESAQLETRLVTVNGELSLAREFVAAQSRDLESLGRLATERLSANADRLASLIHTNSAQIEAIGTVSGNALENMDKLRGQLPVIANAAKDVTNNIGNAGRAAHAQLEDMVAGFHRLNDFGQASERHVATMRETVSATVDEFTRQAELMGEIAAQRFAALADEGEKFRQKLDGDEIAVLTAIRARAGALGEELETARAEAERREAEGAEALAARMATLRDEGGTLSAALREGEDGAILAWRGHVAALTEQARAAWAEIARLDEEAVAAATARLGELTASSTELHAEMAAHSADLGGEIMSRRAELEIAGRSAIEALRSRFGEIDAAIQAQRERHLTQSREIAEHADAVGLRLGEFAATLGTLGAHGDEVSGKLEHGIALLTEKLSASRDALNGTDGAIAELTEGSVRLLELVRASAEQAREQLPQALAGAEERLAGIDARVLALRDALGEAGSSGQALSEHVAAAAGGLSEASGELAALHGALEEKSLAHQSRIAAIREEIAQARSESDALASHVQSTLQSAIDRLAIAARETATGIAGESDAAIDAVAARLGEMSAGAIEQAMAGQTERVIGELEAAVAKAAGASREAALQMRDQLARVDELAGNLERRVNHARARAEEQVDSDFARRVALITESLNSAAIDIAKALSSDVTDTAWASYLRGDRGIFTRRAVALLDGTEARAVAQHYEADRDFRENVNHYIHDFEAMLRNLLSTRDGNALGVTLLSSDMGKLYVALAQGIERIRG
ncbi:MAG TPA: ATPase [Novosphingobium sp.]|nr:ATPase [Novosphingobium sp.]